MKPSHTLFAGILLAFILSIMPHHPAFAVPREQQGRSLSARDSLDLLDSLMANNPAGTRALSGYYAKRAIVIANKSGNPSDLVKAWMIVAGSFTKDNQDSSFFYYNKAMKLANSANLISQKASICFQLSSIYRATYDLTTGIYYLDSTIRFAETTKEFEIMAAAYNEWGNLKFTVQDTAGALKMYKSSLQIAKDHLLYNQMGIVMANLATKFEMDKSKSIKLQLEAIGYLKKVKWTEETIATILLNIGNRYKQPDSALFYFEKALEIARSQTNPELTMGVYNSLAYGYLDIGNIAKAEDCLLNHAIPLALQQKDDEWLSALYDS